MNIIAVNPGHNGSTAFLVDGELKFYIEEERLSRMKYDGNPFRGIMEAVNHGVDFIVLGGTTEQFAQLPWTGEDSYTALVRKYCPNVKSINLGNQHHLGHAAEAFYNSGFEDAAAVIVDGSGTMHNIAFGEAEKDRVSNAGFETESIIDCAYPAEFKNVYKRYGGNSDTKRISAEGIDMDNAVTITKAYEAVSEYLGFGYIEAGKTMGLAPYGKEDNDIPDIFINGRGNKNLLIPNYPAGAHIDTEMYSNLKQTSDPKEWHSDPSKVTDAAKNLAWKVQQETQELVGDLIEKAVALTGKKNIVVAGGYGLNCVANYYLQERFPDLDIWFDPVAHDGGTSIGLAKLVHHSETGDTTVRPLTSLYLGVERQEDYSVLDNIDGAEIIEATPADVAKLIADRNIVALYQGRSEAGPRALGNRSILYDPTDPNGKDFVNQVKGREWFRPFAGSMLAEKFEEWFVTHGLKETPFMMHAMDFKLEKHGEVPAITHVDGTCRIQTVTKEQNEVYYDIIKEFEVITGIPIVFNTSFNLAGAPLVETLLDALNTVISSDIDYLYLPERGAVFKFDKNLRTATEEKQSEAVSEVEEIVED